MPKCIDTGLTLPRDQVYATQVPVNHRDGTVTMKNIYYSSEEAFKRIEADKEGRIKCSDFMFFTILGYESGHNMNSNFYKRLQKWRAVYSYDVILKTMEMVFNKGQDYVSKLSFNSETQRINYWSAAIENNLQDIYMQAKKEERQAATTSSGDEFDLFEMENFKPRPNNKKVDISKFLED